ncbi:TetR/AcrR family transcriptional regulator [Virgibacillus kekensis]|uniref:TetR/AcrR family transcriptional regulator n=1 Tax=Virgibacillus kekensis TaxID=202261 RepID=A0ABV9DLG0_9BACI
MKDRMTAESIRLFEKNGFSQTSIQDIVNALRVTKGTFYYYFSSKEQLLMEIHLEYISNLLGRQQKIMDNTGLSQKEKLWEIIKLLIKDITDKGPSARVFFREIRHLTDDNIANIKQKRDQFRLNIEKIIHEGIEEREFRQNLRTDMITFGILGITNYSYQWYKPDGEVTPEELVDIYVDLVLKGIEE